MARARFGLVRPHCHSRSLLGFLGFACVIILLSAWPIAARADGLAVRVPSGCGDDASFRARVDQLAGPGSSDRASASVAVRAEGKNFRLDVQLPDASRRSRHRDCRVLVDAAALIVALSVNPDLVLAPAPEPAPEPAPAPAPAPEPVLAAKQVSVRGVRRWGLTLHGDGAASFGLLPAAAFPLSAGLRVSRGAFGVGAALRYVPPRSSEGEPRVRVQAGGVRALAYYAAGRYFLSGLGLEADVLHGRGGRVPEARSDVTSRLAAKLELSARLPIGPRQALSLTGSAEAALVRRGFVVAGYGSVFTPETITLSVGLRWEITIL